LGFTIPELSLIEEGQIYDCMSEADNDVNGDYCEVATQEDFNNW
jgi:hypothetical protein